jgi:ATP-dependent DNA helicase DinG
VAQCAARASELAGRLSTITQAEESEGARSVELTPRGFTLSLLPFDVAQRFATITHGTRAAWIFTSATLSVGEDFAHFTTRLGLEDAETLAIASPFDFESQALLYLPPQMPDPAAAAHTPAVIDAAIPLIEASAGGAFVLFTSHRALQRAAQLLRERWTEIGEYPLLVQGEAPREQLLRTFRDSGNAVLLGTASFWEGVDVKGDALRLVVIEKLPFSSPDDALTRARIEHLKANGGNAFREYQLPEAALALKQGVGRLIRSETDRGVVVICDPRLIDKPYGRVFRASLPPMPVTRVASDAEKFLRRIAGTAATPAAMVREPLHDEMNGEPA